MASCTFFGHRDCPDTIRPALKQALTGLITRQGVTSFYVGNQGRFDALALSVLRELKRMYPQIGYRVVLAYFPTTAGHLPSAETIFPEGIERVPPRFAIAWRNRWMLKRCGYVVSYVTRSTGGAAQFTRSAVRQGKTVLSLAKQKAADSK